jgi:quercetin dioxygenase-like cupin family protein
MPMNPTDDVVKGRAGQLAGLVEYQANAVVSRTLVNKPVGTITLFAFDRGQGLSEHTAPFDAFVQIYDGKAEVTISGKVHSVQAGDVILMPAGDPHSLHAAERFKMMLVMIRQ